MTIVFSLDCFSVVTPLEGCDKKAVEELQRIVVLQRLDGATDLICTLLTSSMRSPASRITEIDTGKKSSDLNLLFAELVTPYCKIERIRLSS